MEALRFKIIARLAKVIVGVLSIIQNFRPDPLLLKAADSALSKATDQQKKSDEQLEVSNRMLQSLNAKLEVREKNYQNLLTDYLQTLEGQKQGYAKKKFNFRQSPMPI